MSPHRNVSVRALRGALLSSLFLASSAFADGTLATPNTATTLSVEPHYGYADTVSPEHWGELPGDAMCATGQQQSPIALVTANAVQQPTAVPAFHYHTSHVHMANTGHTVEFAYDVGSTVTLGANEYKLKQFHFHTPSEHTKNGVQYPLELHLVHTDVNGNAALVVGVLIQTGATNAALFNAFQHLPKHQGEASAPVGALINASALLPHNKSFFHYAGSLTTPPCSEGLKWYVMKHPIEMSDAQIAAYQRLAHLNPGNRPVQPLHGRTVTLHTSH
ncbi:carbonic anhydrase [Pyxidicoccus xibeiensis]|uniref:carbonic anhydrase n=1 Tax=Pyxidicoccus xibeiensis TaxID=2906759 RepID=UPI0020A7D65A|nr:carbonic anhydrase family protein [Pyxidicoccus xibeiensis]MCP3144414.1 carbonic anhydrase family protein [Pyxidicoccus xibeiensis]